MLNPTPQSPESTQIPIIIKVACVVVVAAIVGLFVIYLNRESTPTPISFSTQLEEYYNQHGTYPYSLADLPGVEKSDVAHGSDLIYETTDKSGIGYNSYNAMPVTQKPGVIMCGYMINSQGADSFGLNPKITGTTKNSHC